MSGASALRRPFDANTARTRQARQPGASLHGACSAQRGSAPRGAAPHVVIPCAISRNARYPSDTMCWSRRRKSPSAHRARSRARVAPFPAVYPAHEAPSDIARRDTLQRLCEAPRHGEEIPAASETPRTQLLGMRPILFRRCAVMRQRLRPNPAPDRIAR